jgi:carboxylesterase
MVSIMQGAEPWGAEGDQIGVLVVHGFTGSPQSVRPWAEAIAKEGRTVLVPRLPGHGTTVDDLQATTAGDWVGEAEMSLRGLQERCDRIFVCGLSMGGTITLDLAERFGDLIRGIVTVNASLFSTDPRARFAPIVGRLPLKLNGIANDIADPSGNELAYGKVPTKAAWSMLRYQARVMADLSKITQPALLFASRQDHVVAPANATYAAEHIASSEKELVWLERSYHVATLDYDKDLIFERTNAFIGAHAD